MCKYEWPGGKGWAVIWVIWVIARVKPVIRAGGYQSARLFWPIILSWLSYDHNLNKERDEGMDGIDRIIRIKSFSAFTLIDKW